ncbi:hypothetical protein P9K31_04935 [Corynebacterium glutamicum]|uniref:hypothetical protein n=1 Tax=Corynebacterium glutamicum TaxID=1718 RepID=UPI00071EED7B|nr:hypothetical protein [Corynebacterium glutamicum]ALP50558.1 hypothetical protein AC079_10250 [Corynebacterium glutamicum]ANU34079.1 hypothetical protein BBD29_10040 [Corynebacterium glutamicum]APT07823.1 hypothetical protein BSP99_10305 [Corynebacterium glutamicum]QWQ84731.1 hypothetical protein B5C28_10155 [Corynebacterium glutamicum]WFP72635.1 hypothetical protein P9K31_04935 [Corynebacterium glutamicum]
MHNEDFELEVFFVPVGDDVVLALPTGDVEELPSKEHPRLATIFNKVSPLIASVLGQNSDQNNRSAALFEMSADSYEQYKNARLDVIDTYFRGVLRTSKGQASHQVQLREVQQTQIPTGFSPILAAQMAAIQVQLDRIEDSLAELATSISEIMQFLEMQQQSEIKAAVKIIREVHDRAKVKNTISDTDWTRISGHELVLQGQLIAVRDELKTRLEDIRFGNTPASARKQMDSMDPARVANLFQSHRLLTGGLRGWNELYTLRQHQMGELDETDVSDTVKRLKELQDQQEDIEKAIAQVTSPEKEVKPRSRIQRLFTDGMVLGKKNDLKNLTIVDAGRETMKKSSATRDPSLSASSPLMKIVTAEDITSVLNEMEPNLQSLHDDRERKDKSVVNDIHHE